MERRQSAHTYSYQVALGGIIASLCMLCMFLTGVFPMFYLMLPMVASGLIYIMAIETTPRWGLLTYFAVGLLSIFVTPYKEAALVFLLFFGYYPLLLPKLKKIRPRLLSFLCRLALYNGAVLTYFWGSVYLLGADELLESLGDYGKYGGEIMLGMANIVFLSYDYTMSVFPTIYKKRFKPRIFPKG